MVGSTGLRAEVRSRRLRAEWLVYGSTVYECPQESVTSMAMSLEYAQGQTTGGLSFLNGFLGKEEVKTVP